VTSYYNNTTNKDFIPNLCGGRLHEYVFSTQLLSTASPIEQQYHLVIKKIEGPFPISAAKISWTYQHLESLYYQWKP